MMYRVITFAGLVLGLLTGPTPAHPDPYGGGLDRSFGTAGTVVTDFAGIGNHDSVQALLVQVDGGLVAAGTAGVPEVVGDTDLGLARYHPDGALDTGFGNGGKVTTDFAGESDQINSLLAGPDGKLVVAGTASSHGDTDFALARYHRDGSLDTGLRQRWHGDNRLRHRRRGQHDDRAG